MRGCGANTSPLQCPEKGRYIMEQIWSFSLQEIIISEDVKNTEPAAWKMQRKADYYERTGELPEDIVINDENVLFDGYAT